MSASRFDRLRCDICGREDTEYNLLNAIPHDDMLGAFDCCVFCLRSVNGLALRLETALSLPCDFEWRIARPSDYAPSARMYHHAAGVPSE